MIRDPFRRRRLLSKPPEPPRGWMLWHQRLMRVEQVEAIAKAIMKGFDELPCDQRDALNYAEGPPPRPSNRRRRR
jgi:hypothetical protein